MILLDTQAWLYLGRAPELLSRRATSAIRRHEKSGGLRIAAISVWEAVWLYRKGKVRSAGPIRAWLADLVEPPALQVEPLSPEICLTAAELPLTFPSDPADRLIAATAIVLHCPLVTADERIRAANVVETIW